MSTIGLYFEAIFQKIDRLHPEISRSIVNAHQFLSDCFFDGTLVSEEQSELVQRVSHFDFCSLKIFALFLSSKFVKTLIFRADFLRSSTAAEPYNESAASGGAALHLILENTSNFLIEREDSVRWSRNAGRARTRGQRRKRRQQRKCDPVIFEKVKEKAQKF